MNTNVAFLKLHLENFKSFNNVTIDLQEKKNVPKPLVLIYGINGSGKSSIMDSFFVLRESMNTMQLKNVLNDFLTQKKPLPNLPDLKQDALLNIIKDAFNNNSIEHFIHDFKTIGTSSPMILEFEFVIGSDTGSYHIEMSNNSIINERLEYRIKKNRGSIFYITSEPRTVEINDSAFKTDSLKETIKSQIDMYWGKHSLLSILSYELSDKTDYFVKDNFSEGLLEVLYSFQQIKYRIDSSSSHYIAIQKSDNYKNCILNLIKGNISESKKNQLEQIERLLNSLLPSIFKDISRIYFEKNYTDKRINYELYFEKILGKSTFNISCLKESSGTKEILNLLPSLMMAMSGNCVVIDEFASKIHSEMAKKILESLCDSIHGQLIMTTHDLLIMDSDIIKPNSFYYIFEDSNYNREIKCTSEIEKRIHKNYNFLSRYLGNDLYENARPTPTKENEISFKSFAELYR